jgi:hypothetical protein
MPLMWAANALHMEWCLDCHRNPERYVRPLGEVFSFGYHPKEAQEAIGRSLVSERNIGERDVLTNCSICHR